MISIYTKEGDSELGQINIGIEKNRFGPREVYTHLKIDYPTLTLTEPTDYAVNSEKNNTPPPMTLDLDKDMDTNIKDTLSLIERLSN
jgi:hypothetical protein